MMTMLMLAKLINNTWVRKTRIESCYDEAFLDNASRGEFEAAHDRR